jgi:triosephosphate isomerase
MGKDRNAMPTPFVAANWKMNLNAAGAEALTVDVVVRTAGLEKVKIVLCPPFPYLRAVREKLQGSRLLLGAQNLYFEPKGAFTGEISAAMLLDCGCSWVIVGHSERRRQMGETDAQVNRKTLAAQHAGLSVILCVGETIEERNQGRIRDVVAGQLDGSLQGIGADPAKLIIAYEPVWAIGTGVVATPQQAQEMHAFIRQWLLGRYGHQTCQEMRILYGGSVNAANAAELMAQGDVDGLLVGGASLKAEEFAAIASAADANR